MKKLLACALMMMLLVSMLGTTVLADSVDQNGDGSLSTALTFEYKNDPVYTVTIPSAVSMEAEGTDFEITAENVANLDNQKISVTIAGTDKYRNQMVLEGKSADGRNASIRYQFILEDDTVIETTSGKDQVNGVELASFTEDGSVTLTVKPVLSASSATIKGVTYTGTMTYNIGLVENP